MIVKERYNIMLNPRIVEIIDIEAAKLDLSRSAYINDLLLQYIAESGLFFSNSDDSVQIKIEGDLYCD